MITGVDTEQYNYLIAIYVYALVLFGSLQLFVAKPVTRTTTLSIRILTATVILSVTLSFLSVRYGMLILFIMLLLGKQQEEQRQQNETGQSRVIEIRQKLHYSTATVLLLAWIITQ